MYYIKTGENRHDQGYKALETAMKCADAKVKHYKANISIVDEDGVTVMTRVWHKKPVEEMGYHEYLAKRVLDLGVLGHYAPWCEASVKLSFSVNQSEYEQIKKLASKLGLSVAGVIRGVMARVE